jgi:hypothetical protein
VAPVNLRHSSDVNVAVALLLPSLRGTRSAVPRVNMLGPHVLYANGRPQTVETVDMLTL